MRPWRLLIEVGEKKDEVALVASPTSIAETTSVDRSGAWQTLCGARQNLLAATARGDVAAVADINHWIGGGLALMSRMTGEDAHVLLDRLVSDVPLGPSAPAAPSTPNAIAGSSLVIEGKTPQSAPDSNATFYPVERTRPKPPPGAPRALQPEDLTPEERSELGMFLPGEEPPEVPVQAKKTPTKKASAKKAPVKKRAANKPKA